MPNDYFNHDANRVGSGTRALDSQINNIGDEIALAFDKLPSEAEMVEGRARYDVDTGVADAYVVTLGQIPTYTDGFQFCFTVVNANTGAATINVNTLGAKSIINPDGTALFAGALPAGAKVCVMYDSATDSFMLVSVNSSNNGPAVVVEAEAVPLTNRVKKFNFAGPGVTLSEPVTDEVLVTIPGFGGGTVVQVSYTQSVTYGRTTANIILNDSIPQFNFGFSLMGINFTPLFPDSILFIEGEFFGSAQNAGDVLTCTISNQTNGEMLGVASVAGGSASDLHTFRVTAASVAAVNTVIRQYALRVGCSVGDTYRNGNSSGRRWGGMGKVWLRVTEIH